MILNRFLSGTALMFLVFLFASFSPRDVEDVKNNIERYEGQNNLKIIITLENFDVILQKRKEALEYGILITSSNDFVPAQIEFNGTIYEAEIRLKGDWVDHLLDNKKWSYRIKLIGDNTIMGMRKFSIHHPKTRNYINEWLFHKAVKNENLVGLRYDFVSVTMVKGEITDDLGIYALEESFDKRTLESNQRREGLILKFNEDKLWKDRLAAAKVHGKPYSPENRDTNLQKPGHVDAFSMKSLQVSKVLSDQFYIARNLLENYRKKKLPVDAVFELNKIAMYTALCNLFGCNHALVHHNLRFYYNPITSKLEPVSFDGNAGKLTKEIGHYFMAKDNIEYEKELIIALDIVSQPKYVEDLFMNYKKELNSYKIFLNAEFDDELLHREFIEQNARFIQKIIHPSSSMNIYLKDLNKENLTVEITSLTGFPVEIIGISYKKKRMIASAPNGQNLITPYKKMAVQFSLPQDFDTYFIKDKKKYAEFYFPVHFEKIKLAYRMYGYNDTSYVDIIPYPEIDNDFIANDLHRGDKIPALSTFNFIQINESKKTILLKKGYWKIHSTLLIPEKYIVTVEPGTTIDLADSAMIICNSPMFFNGTAAEPVKLISSDKSGKGILVSGCNQKSVVNHTIFSDLSSPSYNNWSLSGAVNFYESPVEMNSVHFINNRCEDALNIIRTNVTLENLLFENIFSDAFDGDFIVGTISNSKFVNMGNDAIDVSGSDLVVTNVTIENAGDKGLSAGEKSKILIKNTSVSNSEVAVACKDLSIMKITGLSIKSCQLGFTAFQKKPEYGIASITATEVILVELNTNHLIETNSTLFLNGNRVQTVDDVLSKMYGNVYGKSSH